MSGIDWLAHRPLTQWLASGERGMSSEAIVRHLTGVSTGRRRRGLDHPYDPSDFRRCQLLLQEVPLLGLMLKEMRTASPTWAALIDRWDEIRETLEREVPGYLDDEQFGRAPEAHALIRECRDLTEVAS